MSKQLWHYMDSQNNNRGPINSKDLQKLVQEGTIQKDTQLWTEELQDKWISAHKVDGLFADESETQISPPTPQPVQPTVRTVQPAAQTAQPAAQPVQPAANPLLRAGTQTAGTNPLLTGQAPAQPIAEPAAQQAAVQPDLNQADQASPYQTPETNPQVTAEGIYPATIKKGGNFGLWIMFNIVGLLFIFVTPLLEKKGIEPIISLALIVVGFGLFISATIMIYMYLYRAWKCLQPGGATVSPGQAVGFLFIPLFNLYWIFKAFGGLPKQWNAITASYSNTQRAPKLSLTAFLCMLFIPVIGQIIWVAQITKALNFMKGLHFQQNLGSGIQIGRLTTKP